MFVLDRDLCGQLRSGRRPAQRQRPSKLRLDGNLGQRNCLSAGMQCGCCTHGCSPTGAKQCATGNVVQTAIQQAIGLVVLTLVPMCVTPVQVPAAGLYAGFQAVLEQHAANLRIKWPMAERERCLPVRVH